MKKFIITGLALGAVLLFAGLSQAQPHTHNGIPFNHPFTNAAHTHNNFIVRNGQGFLPRQLLNRGGIGRGFIPGFGGRFGGVGNIASQFLFGQGFGLGGYGGFNRGLNPFLLGGGGYGIGHFERAQIERLRLLQLQQQLRLQAQFLPGYGAGYGAGYGGYGAGLSFAPGYGGCIGAGYQAPLTYFAPPQYDPCPPVQTYLPSYAPQVYHEPVCAPRAPVYNHCNGAGALYGLGGIRRQFAGGHNCAGAAFNY